MVKQAQPDLVEVNDQAGEIARTAAAQLVTGLSATKKKTIRTLVARSIEQGWSDTTLQQRIQQAAGLSPRDVTALENFRKGLEKQGVPPGRLNRMVDAYAKRLQRTRARLIARTETRQSLMDAQRQVWRRMQQQGDYSTYAVRVTRLHKDERLCGQCAKENGRRRSLRDLGGGPPFHPNCRCWEEIEDEGIEKHLPGEHDQRTHGRRIKVYRGVYISDDPGMVDANVLGRINTEDLGLHWTTDRDVAETYALDTMRKPGGTGVVFEGHVNEGHIETSTQVRLDRHVMGADHFEKEVFLRRDAVVDVQTATIVRRDPDEQFDETPQTIDYPAYLESQEIIGAAVNDLRKSAAIVKIRHVKTPAGVKRFKLPIGAPIIARFRTKESPKPRVHVPNDPTRYAQKLYGDNIIQPSGAPVRGTVMDPETLPNVVWHVSPVMRKIVTDGMLRAGGEGGLGGDRRDQMVSFTTSQRVANQLQRDMQDVATVAQMLQEMEDSHPDWDKHRLNMAQATALNQVANKTVRSLSLQTLEDLNIDGWDPPLPFRGLKDDDPRYDSNSFGDWWNAYFNWRQSKLKLPNPLFFDMKREHWALINPDEVGSLPISRESIQETGALVTNFDLDMGDHGLSEIRVYGDVPLVRHADQSEQFFREMTGGSTAAPRIKKANNAMIRDRMLERLKEDPAFKRYMELRITDYESELRRSFDHTGGGASHRDALVGALATIEQRLGIARETMHVQGRKELVADLEQQAKKYQDQIDEWDAQTDKEAEFLKFVRRHFAGYSGGAQQYWTGSKDLDRYDNVQDIITEYEIIKDVRGAIDGWAETSLDHDLHAQTFQYAVHQAFGVGDWEDIVGYMESGEGDHVFYDSPAERGKAIKRQVANIIREYSNDKPMYDNLVASFYEVTQKALADHGIESVRLYRGMEVPTGTFQPEHFRDGAQVALNPASSWAFDWETATVFGSTVFEVQVPRELVFSTAVTGLGCHNENEFVVLGHPVNVLVHKVESDDDLDFGFLPEDPDLLPKVEENAKEFLNEWLDDETLPDPPDPDFDFGDWTPE